MKRKMKILHTTKKNFNIDSLDQLTEIGKKVRENYDPKTFNCIQIAEMLNEEYSNLIPAEVATFMYDGAVQGGGHVVLKVKGTDFLIDPVGDYAIATNLYKLKKNIQPWIFQKTGNIYLSKNHIPFHFTNTEISEEFSGQVNELDVLRVMHQALGYGLRAIVLK